MPRYVKANPNKPKDKSKLTGRPKKVKPNTPSVETVDYKPSQSFTPDEGIAEKVFPEANERADNPIKFVPIISAEEHWVKESRRNPAVFFEYLSGLRIARHHQMWLANIFHPTRRRVNIIAPRGSGKSTLLNYAMAWYIGANPLHTNGIISVGSTQAEDRLTMIRSIITENIRFKNVYPDIKQDNRLQNTQSIFNIWSSRGGANYSTWRMAVGRFGSLKDPTLITAGRGGRVIIGHRFSGILMIDDIIDENDLSDKQQEKVMTYIMQTLIPCVIDDGRVINIGTRWMLGDVPERLKANPAWHTIEIQALRKNDKGDLVSYWEDYWSVEKLLEKKEEMNNDALFSVMYMNDPTAMSSSLFTIEQLNVDLPIPHPPYQRVYITTDQAISMKERADYNVYMAVGLDASNNYYILDMLRFKSDSSTHVEILKDFYYKIRNMYQRVDAVVMERVGMQAYFQDDVIRNYPEIPVAPFSPKGDKHTRATLVSRYAQAKKLFINQQMADINALKSEWLNFPLAKHDDTLDPMGLLMQYLGESITVAQVKTIRSPLLL